MKSYARILILIVVTAISLYFIILAFSPKSPVALRKFPYPYRAALSICSDIDETESVRKFFETQRFLNTDQETEFGPGLGLEIGGSFIFYNEYFHYLNKPGADTAAVDEMFSGVRDVGISLFAGVSDTLAEGSEIVVELIREGYVDFLHSYGTFSRNGFDRNFAIRSLEFLKAESLLVDVFVNHGGTENRNNIGDAPWQEGDNPASSAYHADITIPSGFKFLWRGQLTHCIGQDGEFSLLNTFKRFYESFQDWRYESQDYCNDNELVHVFELDDGQKVFEFVRYNNPWGKYPIAQEKFIEHQLPTDVIDELISHRGFMVFYTHLGTTQTKPYLHDGTIKVLQYLKQKTRENQLLVTTTSKLLNYYVHHKYLFWHYRKSEELLEIIIDSISNEVEGSFEPAVSDLEGITFYVPDTDKITLKIGNRPIDFLANPKDETGLASITIPWTRLTWPYSSEDLFFSDDR